MEWAFFDSGDILILGIVIIVMTIFRRADKTSRTLERVRKSADKALLEMDSAYDKLKQGLKDLSIDLNTQEDKNKVILQHIATARDEIIGYMQEIEDFRSQVGDYASSLASLKDMSAAVEENLKLISDESSYVDTVGQRLNSLRSEVETLQSNLDTTIENLHNENTNKLNQLGDAVRSEIGTQLEQLSESADGINRKLMRTSEEMEVLADQLENQRNAKQEEFQNAADSLMARLDENINHAIEQGQALEGEIFSSLKDRIEDKTAGLEKNWTDGMVKLRNEVMESVESIHSSLESEKSRFSEWQNERHTALEGIDASISSFNEKVRTEIDEHLENQRLALEEISSRVASFEDEIKGETEQLLNEHRIRLEEFGRESDEAKESVREELRLLREESEEAVSLARRERREEEAARSEWQIQSEESLKALHDEFDAAHSEMHLRCEQLKNEISRNHDLLGQETGGFLEAARSDLEARLSEWRAEAEKMIGESGSELFYRLDAAEAKIAERQQQMDGLQDSLESDALAYQQKLFDSIDEKQNAYSELVDSRFTSLEELAEDINGLEKTLKEQLQNGENLYQEGYAGLMDKLESIKKEKTEQLFEDFGNLKNELARFEHEWENKKNAASEKAHHIMKDLEISFEEDLDKIRSGLETRMIEAEQNISGLQKTRQEQWISRSELELKEWKETINKTLREYTENADLSLTGAEKEIDEYRIRLEGELKQQDLEWERRRETLDSQWADLKSESEKSADEIRNGLKDARDAREIYMNDISGFRDEMDKKLKASSQALSEGIDGLYKRLESEMKSSEDIFYQSLEEKQSGFTELFNSRFNAFEAMAGDLDELSLNLRRSLTETEASIREEFASFGQEMVDMRDRENKDARNEYDHLKTDLAGLQSDLDDLKQSAHERVSEKLQVFEDDFLSHLKKKDDQISAELSEWKQKVDLNLDELEQKSARERDELEKQYSFDLKKGLKEFQSRLLQQNQEIQGQVHGFQERIAGLIESSEEQFEDFRENSALQLEQLQKESEKQFSEEFEDYRDRIQEKLTRSERDISNRLGEVSGSVDQTRKEMSRLFESASSDVKIWQTRILQQMKDQELELNDDIGRFKNDLNENIIDIKNDFIQQRDVLLSEAGEDRERMKVTLGEVSEQVVRLQADLAEKSEHAISRFESDLNDFTLQYQKRMNDARQNSDSVLGEVRSRLKDAREKSEDFQSRFFTKLEEDINVLNMRLEEIDRQQNNFIEQTQIFDRADNLKNALTADIELLQEQLQVTGREKKDLARIEEEMSLVRKLQEEFLDKWNSFQNEKQKVDLLESKINRIVSLSESVDVKLEQVEMASDKLQDYQVKIKQIEDRQMDLNNKFTRLDTKSSVIDATVEGVDRNFETMTSLNASLKAAGEEMARIQKQFGDLSSRTDTLLAGKKDADKVVEGLSGLETTLTEIDKRMGNLKKVIDWLAKSETRFKTMSAEAKENLQIMGTLAKSGTGATGRSASSASSPGMDKRDMVRRLAREGWNKSDIARTTKLSIGEVELILELPGESQTR